MTSYSDLNQFVREALQSGRTREEISASLQASDWSPAEIDGALKSWADSPMGPIPRPVRSGAARDAFFYALLFFAFAMVAGNVIVLLYGQIDYWFPDNRQTYRRSAVTGLRWAVAAMLVFVPVFLALDRLDAKSLAVDSARKNGAVRRWISYVAMFLATVTLLCDALYLVYTFLNGALTLRFLAKSVTIAIIATIVLSYFRQGPKLETISKVLRPMLTLLVLSGLAVIATLVTFGGPGQGRMEQRDLRRISDLRHVASEVRNCSELAMPLPVGFDPMVCVRDRMRLSAFATDISYATLDTNEVELCILLEFPPLATTSYGVYRKDDLACQSIRPKLTTEG